MSSACQAGKFKRTRPKYKPVSLSMTAEERRRLSVISGTVPLRGRVQRPSRPRMVERDDPDSFDMQP